MVNETQQRKWRDDIRSNIDKANGAAGDDQQARLRIALTAIDATSRICLGERISELAQAFSRSDELVTALSDQVGMAQPVIERLKRAIETGEDREMSLAQADEWLGGVGEVDQRRSPIQEGEVDGRD